MAVKFPRKNDTLLDSTPSEDLEAHIKSLRCYALALVGNTADADDLVQETLKRALTYFDDSKEIRNLRAYLMTMLHNVRIDMLKQQKRAGNPIDVESDLPLATLPDQNDRLFCLEVAAAIGRLPEDLREVLLLVGLEGLSYQGAADILDVPIGTVMSRLNRGRKTLRKFMKLESGVDVESCVLIWRVGRPIVEANLSSSVLIADAPSPA